MERTLKGPAGALALFVAVFGLLIGAPEIAAQSEVDPADAEAFLGSWSLPLQTAQGTFELSLDIENDGGEVAAEVGSDQGSQDVERITRQGESLRLEYSFNAQGQSVPVEITLTPDGEDLDAEIDFAGGQFTSSGTATRVGSP